MRTHLYTVLALSLVSACSVIPQGANQPYTPESLLDVSQEVVTIDAVSASSASELSGLLESNSPSRVVVACNPSVGACKKAIKVLNQYGVPYETASEGPAIALHFDNVVAHDCEQGFVSNHINPYNLNYSALGCSVSANTVQMVSDRRQFHNPAVQSPIMADRITRTVEDYKLTPPSLNSNQNFNQILQSQGGS